MNEQIVTQQVRKTTARLENAIGALRAEERQLNDAAGRLANTSPIRAILNLYALRLCALQTELESARAEMHWMGVYGAQGPQHAALVCQSLIFATGGQS